jgi:hypothetical protein
VTLAVSFAPVTGGIRNDEICLHLSIVREWLSHGGLPVLPNAITYQAGNAHLLFLLPAAMGSAAGERLVAWLCFVLGLWAVYAISRAFLTTNNALLAALFAAINPLVFRGAGVAFVDIPSSLFVLLPVVMLLRYRCDRRPGWLVLCGLALGAGVGIKPTNYVYAAAFCIASAAAALLRRRPWKEIRVAVLCIALSGGALFMHWPVRTMILTGSPVFPPPLTLFKSGDLTPLRGGPAPFSHREIRQYYDYVMSRYGDYHRTLVNLARFPWDITMQSSRFQIGDSIGTLFLSLFPCLLLFLPRRRIEWFLTVAALLSATGLYFLVLPEARYYIGAFLLLCPVLAALVQRLEDNGFTRAAARTLIIVNCLFSLLVCIRISGAAVRAAFDRTAAERMKTRFIPFYEAFEFIRKSAIPEVIVASAPQNLYYLPPKTVYRVLDSLEMRLPSLRSAYVLDFDRSQLLDRVLTVMAGDYAIARRPLPENATIVFQGPDARVIYCR